MIRRVLRNGVMVDGAAYIAPELAARVGERVQIEFDGMNSVVRVCTLDGKYICMAERTGVSRDKTADRARAKSIPAMNDARIREIERLLDLAVASLRQAGEMLWRSHDREDLQTRIGEIIHQVQQVAFAHVMERDCVRRREIKAASAAMMAARGEGARDE